MLTISEIPDFTPSGELIISPIQCIYKLPNLFDFFIFRNLTAIRLKLGQLYIDYFSDGCIIFMRYCI